MKLDHSQDYLVEDNLESVTWTSRRNTGDQIDTVLDAVGVQQVSSREAQASGGAYAPGDRWYSIPAVLLANGPPKPGDYLTALDEQRFTVQEVFGRLRDGSGKDQEYRCRGRNLVLHLDLADSITIETSTITLDESGAEVRAWRTLHEGLKAKVVKLLDEQAMLLGISGMKGTYAVIVEAEVAVGDEERIVWAGSPSGYLEILRYHPAAGVDVLPVIDCEATPV